MFVKLAAVKGALKGPKLSGQQLESRVNTQKSDITHFLGATCSQIVMARPKLWQLQVTRLCRISRMAYVHIIYYQETFEKCLINI